MWVDGWKPCMSFGENLAKTTRVNNRYHCMGACTQAYGHAGMLAHAWLSVQVSIRIYLRPTPPPPKKKKKEIATRTL